MKKLKIGYAFWGHMADMKMKNGKLLSSPDGNAFYSWSIVNSLVERGHDVRRVFPDRDAETVNTLGINQCFSSFAKEARSKAYLTLGQSCPFDLCGFSNELDELWVIDAELRDLDVVLLEWRFPIPGRNTEQDFGSEHFQPDLIMSNYIIDNKDRFGYKVIAFDLDYKMMEEDYARVDHIIELGDRWSEFFEKNITFFNVDATKVHIPFDFRYIDEFPVLPSSKEIVYVGNRYERDWAVDKYVPNGSVVYGNWLESGRDSKLKWPEINFVHRAQQSEFRNIMKHAAVTPLLLKESYCSQSFMTARLIECILFGVIPLGIIEFKGIHKYLPSVLIVSDKEDVIRVSKLSNEDYEWRKMIIKTLRHRLRKQFDSSIFAKQFEEICENICTL